MGTSVFYHCVAMCLIILFLPTTCMASVRNIGKINPGFRGSQMNWIDNDGMILLSNSSNFAFGFTSSAQNVTSFLLVVIHMDSKAIVWSANRGSPVRNSDNFVFDYGGNAYLKSGKTIIWSTDTDKKGVSAMELQDSGNLAIVGDDGTATWQSFNHPTDTLLSHQEFTEGMKLISNPNSNNLSHYLEIKSGDMVLSAGFLPSQPYWSMGKENRRTINKGGEIVTLAILNANSWTFYDQSKGLLWQFIFSNSPDVNATWAAVLGDDGFITFYNLQSRGQPNASPTKIPMDPCSRPESCDPYFVCNGGNRNRCQCPSAISSRPNCNPGFDSSCHKANASTELVDAGEGLGYFALGHVPPTSKTDLTGCKVSCLNNCSCLAMFFENNSGSCYLFNQIGSFQGSNGDASFIAYIKVLSTGEGRNSRKGFPIFIIIAILTALIILGIVYGGFSYYCRKMKKRQESPTETSEEDNFIGNLSGMPVRYSYRDLQTATNDFSEKIGQGGFGSVYKGVLPDGTQLAVKKLEGLGQGKKEFRTEVSVIGSIHHQHLVRLRGFCAEGTHRMLAYEYMANGSLDRWLFKKNKQEFLLDWDTRYSIAVGTAKGLAYLHEDCDAKIVHCDIKPENVLLDDNFAAKVSDFGLAKLMTREQSHVFTTLRGTRGYLAPEWITSYAISEKSDVYSYGMVLLEILGGRKSYDPSETSQKTHFPSYAFKMMEQGKLRDVIDSKMKINEEDERVSAAIKVALWCIQDDVYLRPSMTKVVQMLEGLYPVSQPPSSFQMGSRLYTSFFNSISEEGTSLGPSDGKSDAYLSAARLSGPR